MMKLISVLQQLKTYLPNLPSLNKQPEFNLKWDLFLQLLFPFCLLILFSILLWFVAPFIAWEETIPFATPEKRFYLISFIFLLWLMKILWLDTNKPHPLQYKNKLIRKKIIELHQSFFSLQQQLKSSPFIRYGKTIFLNELPYYLLIGPQNAGKTSLLTQSKVNFILPNSAHPTQKYRSFSEESEWWITQDANIINISGRWFRDGNHQLTNKKPKVSSFHFYHSLWFYLLRLFKNQQAISIHGLMIALPLAEILKENDKKKYDQLLKNLFSRLQMFKKIFNYPIPCQLIVTKCDLLPGFIEFFSESSQEEINQAWGVIFDRKNLTLEICTQRFNQFIKKLNQQLLWRLHHERDPEARILIKNFPLQIERMKELCLDFIKKFSNIDFNLSLQSIHFTSAEQSIDDNHHRPIAHSFTIKEHAVEIFSPPTSQSRSYFIKQLILHPKSTMQLDSAFFNKNNWQKKTPYLLAFLLIFFTFFILGNDFNLGIKYSQKMQQVFSNYESNMRSIHNSSERLRQTLILLNELTPKNPDPSFKLDLRHPFSFYSTKLKLKTKEFYQHALDNIFIPELRNYLADYLENPVNKQLEQVYAVLQSYLMLNDAAHFLPELISLTVQSLTETSLSTDEIQLLTLHMKNAFNSFHPVTLDTKLIEKTRHYLGAMPTLILSDAILKNIGNNHYPSNIQLNIESKQTIFIQQTKTQIPFMFTASYFPLLMTSETNIAIQEALKGNWVTGVISKPNVDLRTLPTLEDQLRLKYINQYISFWENLLSHIQFAKTDTLLQTDLLIKNLINPNSPLLHILQIFYDNTFFEPIISYSNKLHKLGLLFDVDHSKRTLLYQIFIQLQSLHQELQTVLNSPNINKAAFTIVAKRMTRGSMPDAITQLRFIATKSPEPINIWLDKIADQTWQYLMQAANHYMDISNRTTPLSMLPLQANFIPRTSLKKTFTGKKIDIY